MTKHRQFCDQVNIAEYMQNIDKDAHIRQRDIKINCTKQQLDVNF